MFTEDLLCFLKEEHARKEICLHLKIADGKDRVDV